MQKQLDSIARAGLNHDLYAETNGNPWPLEALILVENLSQKSYLTCLTTFVSPSANC